VNESQTGDSTVQNVFLQMIA